MEFVNVFWFRRDLRLNDNHGLYKALNSGLPVLPIFIFDNEILNQLENKTDLRVQFIHQELSLIKKELNDIGSDLCVYYGQPLEIYKQLVKEYSIKGVFTNEDYEPYAIKRDQSVNDFLFTKGISFSSFKDQCVFDYREVLKDDGKPYTVYTPYSKKWKTRLNEFPIVSYPSETLINDFLKNSSPTEIVSLESMGFEPKSFQYPEKTTKSSVIQNYEKNRDIPSIEGTSKLSIHFRFGTISIREKAKKALQTSEKWLNELIWRDFYMQILAHFPHVVNGAFKPEYDKIEWEKDEADFLKWCQGKTGYPIVDAGMRELNATGLMHNRVRMIVASFLCKHLLISWRWGEAYFAAKLLDFELASNNGGWQWAAGSGVDAAPYFRIFNPTLQTEKFDPNLKYIKKWVPEFGTIHYAKPIVEHTFARQRCLERYKSTLAPTQVQ
ncbi:MAG: deoxyribodipyrimidine photo-lyase [Bacteroidota bacterium]|nr:deoxyribodipyrimidine photo-lyase [Bacteroidota bacterium]